MYEEEKYTAPTTREVLVEVFGSVAEDDEQILLLDKRNHVIALDGAVSEEYDAYSTKAITVAEFCERYDAEDSLGRRMHYLAAEVIDDGVAAYSIR